MASKILKRINTNKIFVKNIQIGGVNKVVIQSMTTVKTSNFKDCLNQIKELSEYGCEIVRVAVLDEDDLNALKNIIPYSPVPLVADIHYRHDFAIKAIEYGINKIRINPGNISDINNTKQIIEACKKHNVPIRIGINGGSLPKHIIKKYGYDEKALIATAKENIDILEKLKFHNYLLSLKHTNPDVVVNAYIKASKIFKCPLHIGVTEAGGLVKGTIKSTYAISKLLQLGIGDTIRISLSANPIYEVIAAKELLTLHKLTKNDFPNLISCPTCGRLQFNMLPIVNEIDNYLNKLKGKINIAIMGCVVNGLGEAKNADITVVGSNNKGIIYVKGKVLAIVKETEIVSKLKKIIDKYLKNELM